MAQGPRRAVGRHQVVSPCGNSAMSTTASLELRCSGIRSVLVKVHCDLPKRDTFKTEAGMVIQVPEQGYSSPVLTDFELVSPLNYLTLASLLV